MELEGEVPEVEAGRSRVPEEVVRQLGMLEQQGSVSEVLLWTLVQDQLGQQASQTAEEFTTCLATPVLRPTTLEEAQGRLESRMGVIHGLQLDAWRELQWNTRWLRGTEEEVEESEEASEEASEESVDGDYEPLEEE